MVVLGNVHCTIYEVLLMGTPTRSLSTVSIMDQLRLSSFPEDNNPSFACGAPTQFVPFATNRKSFQVDDIESPFPDFEHNAIPSSDSNKRWPSWIVLHAAGHANSILSIISRATSSYTVSNLHHCSYRTIFSQGDLIQFKFQHSRATPLFVCLLSLSHPVT